MTDNDLNSLSEHNGQTVKRTGSQNQDDLQRVPTFSNLTRTITDVNKHILNDLVEKIMTEKSVDKNLDISYHSVNIEKVKELTEDK